MIMATSKPIEITAFQAWFLADHLRAGIFPWVLAITQPYVDPVEREPFNDRCVAELQALNVMDSQGRVRSHVAKGIRTVCHCSQWLEWRTVRGPEKVLRAVLARDDDDPFLAYLALRDEQAFTLTPVEIGSTEDLQSLAIVGLDQRQQPAVFEEFDMDMDVGAAIDKRVAAGADVAEALVQEGISLDAAEVMETARRGERTLVELTAHDLVDGRRSSTDVSVNIIDSRVGRILVAPGPGEPRVGGVSTFAPGTAFQISVALRNLTERLPSGSWFPEELLTY